MNEVNVDAPIESIVGVFVVKCLSAHTLLSAFACHQHLSQELGLEVPFVLYDQDNESQKLTKISMSSGDINDALEKIHIISTRDRFREYFQKIRTITNNNNLSPSEENTL